MNLPILARQQATNHQAFVLFWKDYFDESYNHTYDDVINKVEWDTDDVYRLFAWKNNMKGELGKSKKVFVTKVLAELDLISQLRKHFDKDRFDKAFKHLGPIWVITLLHAIQPDQYPIFDQHVYRAYCFLTTNTTVPKLKRSSAYNIYFKDYLKFFPA